MFTICSFQKVYEWWPADVEPVEVEPGLGGVANSDGSVNILNMKNVSYVLSPQSCDDHHWLVITVATGPKNKHLRDLWRHDAEGRNGLKTLFMVANPKTGEDQRLLEEEHEAHGDILQCDVPDGHRLLAYKNLCGHIWTYQHCSRAKHVTKSDDNVRVDLRRLLNHLVSDTHTDWNDLITCPTKCFGMLTIRSESAHMNGNWSHSVEEFHRDVMPPFCVGFLSLTTPAVGAKLAQVGLKLYGDQKEDVTLIEDSLITGILKERLPGVRLEMMFLGQWKRIFTWCSFIHVFKQTFFNDLIISKISSRSNVHYVGRVTNPQVWKFFLCSHLEGVLMNFEKTFPEVIPPYVWDVCMR